MASHCKVINLTSDRRIKRSQALGRIEHCISAWVEYGISIRDLTLAESIAARSQQARLSTPLPFAELPSVVFRVPDHMQAAQKRSLKLVVIANRMCESPVGT